MNHYFTSKTFNTYEGSLDRKAVSRSHFFHLVPVFFMAVTLSAGAQTQTAPTALKPETGGMNSGTVFQRYPSSLGVSAFTFGGGGLSWQRWFGNTGLEIAAGGIWDPTTTSSEIYDYTVSATISRMLFSEDFADWFTGGLSIAAIAGHSGREGYRYVYKGEYSGSYERYPYSPSVFAGVGIGIESVLARHFSEQVQFFYVARFISNPGIEFGATFSFRYRY